MTSAPFALVALLLLAGSWPALAETRTRSPALVEEDLPPEEPPVRHVEPLPPAPPVDPSPRPKVESKGPEPATLVRSIQRVRVGYGDLLEAWYGRRQALREHDLARAAEAEKRLLDVRGELAIEALDEFAGAEIRASALALNQHNPIDALAAAELAVALSPELPAAHMALARARLARGGDQAIAAFSSMGTGLSLIPGDPRSARAALADFLFAGLVASGIGSIVILLVLFLRRCRLVIHDFRHLPLMRMVTPLQATFIAIVILALPLLLRLGPAVLIVIPILLVGPYLDTSERFVATLALAAIALFSLGVRQAVQATAWTGTLAEDVRVLERGADDGRIAARLGERAARGALPSGALVALGRHHKRRGDLDRAMAFYTAAGDSRPDVLVNQGNIHLLRGDDSAAKAAYMAAVDRATTVGDGPSLAAAHYDLSKVFLRQAALEQAQEARKKASLGDPALISRLGTEDDYRANRWLIDVPLAAPEIRSFAVDDAPRLVEEQVIGFLGGPLPRVLWPFGPLAAALALWPLALLARVRLSVSCERCGRPACERCDSAPAALCGQCINVFVKRGVVEPRDRAKKERQVRRHARLERLTARALAVLAPGVGQIWRGEVVRGSMVLLAVIFLFALVLSWRGVAPTVHSADWLPWVKLAIAAPLAIIVWVSALRDVFAQTRG